jgi:hypothetical protein
MEQLIKSYRHFKIQHPEDVKLVLESKNLFTFPNPEVDCVAGLSQKLHLKECRGDMIVVSRSFDQSKGLSSYKLKVVAEGVGESNPTYKILMESGKYQRLDLLLQETDYKSLEKQFRSFEISCEKSGFPSGNSISEGSSLGYELTLEVGCVTYSCHQEAKTFYKFGESELSLLMLSEHSIELALDSWTKKVIYNDEWRRKSKLSKYSCIISGKNSPREQSNATGDLKQTKSQENEKSEIEGPFSLLKEFSNSPTEKPNPKRQLNSFVDDSLRVVEDWLAGFIEIWKDLELQSRLHPEHKDSIQQKFSAIAKERLKPLRWWIQFWILPLTEILAGIIMQGENATDRKMNFGVRSILDWIEELLRPAQDLLSKTRLEVSEFGQFFTKTQSTYPEETFILFDSAQLLDIISKGLEVEGVFDSLTTIHQKKLIDFEPKSAASESKDRCQKWMESKRPVRILFDLGSSLINSLKLSAPHNAEIWERKTRSKSGEVSQYSSQTFKFFEYTLSFDQKTLTWFKDGSKGGSIELLGLSHWTRPYLVNNRLFYLSNDLDEFVQGRERSLDVNLVVVDLTQLREKGEAPTIQRVCRVLNRVRAIYCDIVANQHFIAMQIHSFMGQKYLCMVPNSLDLSKVPDPVVKEVKDYDPFKKQSQEITEKTPKSTNYYQIEIRGMQFYGDHFIVATEEKYGYQTKTMKYHCLKWRQNLEDFLLLSTLEISEDPHCNSGFQELNGIAWLESKGIPYIVQMNGPAKFDVITLSNGKLIRVKNKYTFTRISEDYSPFLMFSRSFSYNKPRRVCIWGITGNSGTPLDIATQFKIKIKHR